MTKYRNIHISYHPLQYLFSTTLSYTAHHPSRRIDRHPLPMPLHPLRSQVILLHLPRPLPITTPLEIQHHNARIPRQDIHPRPIDRRIQPPLRPRLIINNPLHRPTPRVHNRDIRMPRINNIHCVEPRCVRAPAGCYLVGHHDVM